jgi:prepilin signal peptidase PulO-like enzyme (type II secretory pathway)
MNTSIASFFIHPSSLILHPFLSSLILSLWLFAVGAAIGSFLNVVVYRLPRGISLVKPGSHCPACKKPIRWYDNVPIFGWFLLRGRCRDCRARISFRYPLVEAIAAVMFLAVGMAEGFPGGADLPQRTITVDGTVFPVPPAGGPAILVAYHLVLLSTLLAAGLIEYDGYPFPWRLMLPALMVGAVAPLVWPPLRPLGLCSHWSERIIALLDGGTGFAVGALLGLAMVRQSQRVETRGFSAQALGPACVGLFVGCGWAAILGLLTLLLFGLATLAGQELSSRSKWQARVSALRDRFFPDLFLTAATFAWILALSHLVRLSVW